MVEDLSFDDTEYDDFQAMFGLLKDLLFFKNKCRRGDLFYKWRPADFINLYPRKKTLISFTMPNTEKDKLANLC